jgi:Family of unknown function (DUF5985)
MEFIDGASALACIAIALFFLRFFRETHDRLFAIFAAAFAVFAVNRVILTALDDESEARTFVYVARLLAFTLIAYAVYDKNRPDGADG